MTRTERVRNGDFEERINDYFSYCDAVNETKDKIVKPYTLSGMLCYIGVTREEFERMSKIKRHEKLVSRAKAKIEAFIEENALAGNLSVNAAANSLKFNFGWGEKQDRGNDGNDKSLKVTLSPEAYELAR